MTTDDVLKEIRESLVLEPDAGRLSLALVVKNQANPKLNKQMAIPCHGYAIAGYPRDVSADTYLVDCVYWVDFGTVPWLIKLQVPGSAGWSTRMPLPRTIIEKFLGAIQKRQLKLIRSKFPEPEFSIEFVQMIGY